LSVFQQATDAVETAREASVRNCRVFARYRRRYGEIHEITSAAPGLDRMMVRIDTLTDPVLSAQRFLDVLHDAYSRSLPPMGRIGSITPIDAQELFHHRLDPPLPTWVRRL
jgi:hypothetical protein